MKKYFNWQVVLGILLIILSAVVYYVHYLIFRDPHHIFIYLIGDVAFVFLEVLLVSLVIHKLMHHVEHEEMLKKLNMVIGAFFSEVGRDLLKMLCSFDRNSATVTEKLSNIKEWPEEKFSQVYTYLQQYEGEIELDKEELSKIKELLVGKKKFLLNLLENPNLLEHSSFTKMLWAIFHLTEELEHRNNLSSLPDTDYDHISKDIKRAYNRMITQWVSYVDHLRGKYPYLFSLAVRTNPFDEKTPVEVME